MIEIGTVLCTKDSHRYTNAVVIKSDYETTTVLTDFGNQLEFVTEVLFEHYEVSQNWRQAKQINYPLPTIEERIQEQIELLYKALVHVQYPRMIYKKDLIHLAAYRGKCRNSAIAIWNNDLQVFTYTRVKFGSSFEDQIPHIQDANKNEDGFIPEELIS
jgi:hypothetical protein